MALGAIAVVAAGAIGGVLMKYVFSGPSGPAHQVVAPQAVDGFTRSANLEKQLEVAGEAAKVAKASGGQASDVVSAVYQKGSISPGADAANTQIFMFVGGKLAGADPGASVANFEQSYAGVVGRVAWIARRSGGLHRDAPERAERVDVRVVRQRHVRHRGVADDDDREARRHDGRGPPEPGALREVAVG